MSDVLPARIGSVFHRVGRALRTLRVRLGGTESRPLFVAGCQRSGTTMVLKVLDAAPECRVYHEDNREAFDEDFRLRDEATIRRLVVESPEPVVVFKPLQDSQHTPRLLDTSEDARAIWLYRHYRGAVGSALRKWGDIHRELVVGVANGRRENTGEPALAEGLTDGGREMLDTFADGDLSPADGSLLHWCVRNLIYFEFAEDPRITPVSYEELVSNPVDGFGRVFRFAGSPFEEEYVRDVSDDRLGAYRHVRFDPELEERAEHLYGKLERRRNRAARETDFVG